MRKVQLRMACDKGARVVVNGAVVHASPTAHGLEDFEKLKIESVPLKKGWNTLLMSIAQSAGAGALACG